MIIKLNQVAAQLYTIREFTQTPADLQKSLKKIKSIGYQAVQLSGHGPIENVELKKILDDSGLVACSTHENGDDILNEPKKVCDKLLELGIKSTAYPFPAGIDFSTLKDVKAFARKLDKAGKVFADNKLVLAYHNHNNEFVKFKDKTILEIIYDNTDPAHLQAELDTYWVQTGGGSPVAWIEKMKKRMILVHYKDCGVNPDRTNAIKEIGQGNLDWVAITKAAKKSGAKWYIVEQDNNFTGNDPFKSLRISFNFIKNNLCVPEKTVAAKKTAAAKPAAKKPVAKKTAAAKPAAKKPVAKKTAAAKPAAKKPVAKKTAAVKPAAKKSAAKKSDKK